jgi:hypothetical protein
MNYPRSFIILVILQAVQSLSLLGLGLFRLLNASQFQILLARQSELASLPREFLLDILGLGATTIGSFLIGGSLIVLCLVMLRRRSWAWTMSMTLQGVLLALLLFAYLQHQPNFALMFLGILVVFYLNDGEVQAFLKAQRVT